jgi:hypothetical protein
MSQRLWNIIEGFLLCFIVLASGTVGYFVSQYVDERQSASSLNITEYQQCSNLSLQETATCLRDYVATFYNYTVRDDTPKTLEDIKASGGDCYDYSLLYVQMANELGFYAKKITIDSSNTTAHAITIISGDYAYCLMEQTLQPICHTLSPNTSLQNVSVANKGIKGDKQ